MRSLLAPYDSGVIGNDRLQQHSFPLKVKNTFISEDQDYSEDEGLALGDAFQRRQVSAPAASAYYLPNSYEPDLPSTALNLPNTPLARIAPESCRETAKAHATEMERKVHSVDGVGEVESDMQDEDDEQDCGGDYATLHMAGAQTSVGSIGHPNECMPCTFYCFTRRGCNRGQECKFCHLTHQSKLQLRRECWKKQQRDKRKSIRERVAQEALATRTTAMARGQTTQRCAADVTNSFQEFGNPVKSKVSANGRQGKSQMLSDTINKVVQAVDFRSQGDPYPVFDMSQFSYTPSQATLTLGRSVEIWPKLAEAPLCFHLATALPSGLNLNPSNGVIQGTPVRATARMIVVVQATLENNRLVRACVDMEVVDFVRDGYAVGHVNEIEPGRQITHSRHPESVQVSHEVGGQFIFNGAQPARKPGAKKDIELSPSHQHGSGPAAQVCSNCGHRLHPEARFCTNCGIKRQDEEGYKHAPPVGFYDNDLFQQVVVEPSGMLVQRF